MRFDNDADLKLFDILEKLYSQTSLTFHEAMTSFRVSSGVRQGGPESPLLFNLYIDYVIKGSVDKRNFIEEITNFYEHQYRIQKRRTSANADNEKLSDQSSLLHGPDINNDNLLFD